MTPTNMHVQEIGYDTILKIRQEVMYPDKDTDFVKLADDDRALHLAVCVEEKPVTIVSIFLEGKSVQMRKLATLVKMQKKGCASFLIKWLIAYMKEMKLDKLWCNARVDNIEFYKKFGFVETDKKFERDGLNYVVMDLNFIHL